ncbi:MAG: hydantoinase/oxoprolinase family protein, partial [Pseudomonadota bacterium]
SKGLFQRLLEFDPDAINATLAALEQEANSFVTGGAGTSELTVRLTAHMRYAGQGWEIPVGLPYRTFQVDDRTTIQAAFESAYRTLFGRTIDGLPIEITNWSLIVSTTLPDVVPIERHLTTATAPPSCPRQFYDAALRATVEAQDVSRADVTPGVTIEGPAVIVEDETSTIVTSAYRAIGQSDRSLLLLRKED